MLGTSVVKKVSSLAAGPSLAFQHRSTIGRVFVSVYLIPCDFAQPPQALIIVFFLSLSNGLGYLSAVHSKSGSSEIERPLRPKSRPLRRTLTSGSFRGELRGLSITTPRLT